MGFLQDTVNHQIIQAECLSKSAFSTSELDGPLVLISTILQLLSQGNRIMNDTNMFVLDMYIILIIMMNNVKI